MTTLRARIKALVEVGNFLKKEFEPSLLQVMQEASLKNPWFTLSNIKSSIQAIAQSFLSEKELNNWIENYPIIDHKIPKKIGMILAGNIPLVGLHDIICTFVAGHISLVKYSEKDDVLIPFLIEKLVEIDGEMALYFVQVDRLKGFDAVIATGSNNSSRYFESYFSKVPHIIRKNRNAVAVLFGDETNEDFYQLGKDIFSYFGLGCRNVAKLYVPAKYDFVPLLNILHEFNEVVLHNKYKNNFDYNMALFMLNKATYLNNGALMVVEDKRISSRIASVNFEYYNNINELILHLDEIKEDLQCVVSKKMLGVIPTLLPGLAQQPALSDYADGVDTLTFLLDL